MEATAARGDEDNPWLSYSAAHDGSPWCRPLGVALMVRWQAMRARRPSVWRTSASVVTHTKTPRRATRSHRSFELLRLSIRRPPLTRSSLGAVALTQFGENQTGLRGRSKPDRNQRPLRSRATSLIPFLSPSALTTSSLAGTVILLRGERQMPDKTLGVFRFAGRAHGRQAVEDQGRRVVDAKLVVHLPLVLDPLAQLNPHQAIEHAFGQPIGEIARRQIFPGPRRLAA